MNYKKLTKLIDVLNKSQSSVCINPVTGYNLTFEEAAYLFSEHAYHKSHRSAKDIAKRISHFLRKNGNVRRDTKAWRREYQ